jgi:sugar-phosphatase
MRITTSAVMFDSDGVLIDSHAHVAVAWRQVAAEFDLDFDVLIKELAGVPSEATFSRHLPAAEVTRAVRRLEDLEVDLADSSKALPGALRLLEQLPADSWTIVTSGSRRLAEARWRGAGIPIPPRVVTADDVTAGKPNPEPYQTAAHMLGVDPRHSVVFEDSAAGGKAGELAGATVIAVGNQPWSTQPVARVETLTEVNAQPGGPPITLVVDALD